jgi:hypothetical protein
VNFAEFVRHRENPTCFEMVGPPDCKNLLQIENQTHGYVDPVLLAVVEVFGDDTNLCDILNLVVDYCELLYFHKHFHFGYFSPGLLEMD